MSMEIALSGINAVKSELDTISNNIANSSTYGFKSGRTTFAATYAGTQPTGVEIAATTQNMDRNGGISLTGRSLDVAIQGKGFFVTKDPSGRTSYTRVGAFNVSRDGTLMDELGNAVQGYEIKNGRQGALVSLKVPQGDSPAKASDSINYAGNMSAEWKKPVDDKGAAKAFKMTDPTTFNHSALSVIYDSLGQKHSITQYFVQNDGSDVDVYYAVDGKQVAGATDKLSFNNSGQLVSGGAIALNLNNKANKSAENIVLNISYDGVTRFSGESSTTVNNSDGHAAGVLSGFKLEENGMLVANYSNGEKSAAGCVALATFENSNGLVSETGTRWISSPQSGEPLLSTPDHGLAGKLVGGALEQSNVDITKELVGLMSAQRNYQANTKVISTENQVIQSLMQAM